MRPISDIIAGPELTLFDRILCALQMADCSARDMRSFESYIHADPYDIVDIGERLLKKYGYW